MNSNSNKLYTKKKKGISSSAKVPSPKRKSSSAKVPSPVSRGIHRAKTSQDLMQKLDKYRVFYLSGHSESCAGKARQTRLNFDELDKTIKLNKKKLSIFRTVTLGKTSKSRINTFFFQKFNNELKDYFIGIKNKVDIDALNKKMYEEYIKLFPLESILPRNKFYKTPVEMFDFMKYNWKNPPEDYKIKFNKTTDTDNVLRGIFELHQKSLTGTNILFLIQEKLNSIFENLQKADDLYYDLVDKILSDNPLMVPGDFIVPKIDYKTEMGLSDIDSDILHYSMPKSFSGELKLGLPLLKSEHEFDDLSKIDLEEVLKYNMDILKKLNLNKFVKLSDVINIIYKNGNIGKDEKVILITGQCRGIMCKSKSKTSNTCIMNHTKSKTRNGQFTINSKNRKNVLTRRRVSLNLALNPNTLASNINT